MYKGVSPTFEVYAVHHTSNEFQQLQMSVAKQAGRDSIPGNQTGSETESE